MSYLKIKNLNGHDIKIIKITKNIGRDVVLWNGSLAFLDDVIVGCWDFYEDGTGDELKGRSVTKDGAKSTSPSKINL
jgi:hypothetical protein